MAVARFFVWLRSCWQDTTTPVGSWEQYENGTRYHNIATAFHAIKAEEGDQYVAAGVECTSRGRRA